MSDHSDLLRRAAAKAHSDEDPRWHTVANLLDQHAVDHITGDCYRAGQSCVATEVAQALLADDPGANPCPHGVELDMCDTRECAHTLNQITKEA